MNPQESGPEKKILVFCSSSGDVPRHYQQAASELGSAIARRGCELIFGGTDSGLMRAVADGVCSGGGRVTGVIPRSIHEKNKAFAGCYELMVAGDLRDRKARMDALSDAIICLPGGFGTLDELMETLALKQLGMHVKPVVLLNVAGYFDPLVKWIDRMLEEKFIRPVYRDLFSVATAAEEAVNRVLLDGGEKNSGATEEPGNSVRGWK